MERGRIPMLEITYGFPVKCGHSPPEGSDRFDPLDPPAPKPAIPLPFLFPNEPDQTFFEVWAA